jgi:hypothetical protein
MQKFVFVLFQIDEACRYLLDGRLAQLRLALLLLDNAVEVQMEHRIEQELGYEDARERIRSRVLELPPAPERERDFRDILEWQPLSEMKKGKIARYFDEKVAALSTRWPHLPSHVVQPLKHLHRYRNEAYHRAHVRRETIETAAKLLLDINCEMLMSVYPRTMVYASDQDYSWLEQRFGEQPMRVMGNQIFLERAVREFRSIIPLNDETVASTLAEHTESRFEEFFGALDFIVENTRCPDRRTAFNDSQYFGEVRRKAIDPARRRIEGYQAQCQLPFIDQLIRNVEGIRNAASRLEAFRRFSVIESQFEPLEDDVSELAAEVDHMIQMEIDRLRGK